MDIYFNACPYIIIGFIYKNEIYPIKIDDVKFMGQWDKTIEYFNSTFKHNIFSKKKQNYFVKNGLNTIYRLIK